MLPKERFAFCNDCGITAQWPHSFKPALKQATKFKTNRVAGNGSEPGPNKHFRYGHTGLASKHRNSKQNRDPWNNKASNSQRFNERCTKKSSSQPAWVHVQPGRQITKPVPTHVLIVSPGLNQTESAPRLRASSMAW